MIQKIFCHYIMLNFLLAIGCIGSKFLGNSLFGIISSFKQQLTTARFLLLYIPCVYLLGVIIKAYYFPGPTFIFQLPNIGTTTANIAQAHMNAITSINQFTIGDYVYSLLLIPIALAFILKSINLFLQLIKLKQLILNSVCIKRCNNVHIIVSDTVITPFCFSYLRRSYIVVTSELLTNYQHYRLAIKHELQHLRHKDTLWIYVLELFKSIFYFNPFIHIWIKHQQELQELTCDEVLIREQLVCSHDYADCLLEAAKQAKSNELSTKDTYSTAVGLYHSKKSLTTWRITMLFEYKKNQTRRGLVLFISACISIIIATTSYAVQVTSSNQNKPLNTSLFTNNYIMKWSNEAVLKTFTYDYTNYKTNLENTSHYFTPNGWKAFMLSLKNSGNINAVTTKQLMVSAVSTAAPKIIQQGIENHCYVWHVMMPITVVYSSKTTPEVKQTLLAQLVISRTDETANGIGINQYIVTQRNN